MYAFLGAGHRGEMDFELPKKGEMVANLVSLKRVKGGQPINSQA